MLDEHIQVALRVVLQEVRPDELDAFDLEAPMLIADAISGVPARRSDDNEYISGFGAGELESAALYLKLIAAIIAVLKASGLLGRAQQISAAQLSALQANWQRELEQNRLDTATAALIASRFCKELLDAQRGGKNNSGART